MNDWDRVIAAVVARRSELGLTQKELALKAEVAERTIQNLEAGKRPQPLIRGKIEKALGWPAGEMLRIAGGAARPKPDPLAKELGKENAVLVRRELAKRGEAGRVVLAEMERVLSSPGEGEGAQSEPGRAVS